MRARLTAWVAAVVLLAGCSSLTAPISQPSDESAWIDAPATSGSLVYISDQYLKKVFVYTYPQLKLVGKLSGFAQPDGECADSAGNVWITDYLKQQIVEYAHGANAPKRRLSDAGYFPYSCAVNPRNGDLAVVNFETNPVPGSLSIYKKASGSPQVFSYYSLDLPFFVAYDANGKLFVDGYRGFYSPDFVLASFNGKSFTNINVDHAIASPGDIVVAGSRVNIADSFHYDHVMYGFRVNGSQAHLVGITHLFRTDDVAEFDVVGKSLVLANVHQLVGSGMIFPYPRGGTPQRIFGRTELEGPVGLVISK